MKIIKITRSNFNEWRDLALKLSRWALEHGCTELASDALIENTASYDFHTKVGFQEVERVVTFIKQISL